MSTHGFESFRGVGAGVMTVGRSPVNPNDVVNLAHLNAGKTGYLRVKKTTTQVITPGAFQPNTFKNWQTIERQVNDVGGTFDLATGVFTCTAAGLFQVWIYYQYNATTVHDLLEIMTAPYPQNELGRTAQTFGNNYMHQGCVYLEVGEQVSFSIWQLSGANKDMMGATIQIIKFHL